MKFRKIVVGNERDKAVLMANGRIKSLGFTGSAVQHCVCGRKGALRDNDSNKSNTGIDRQQIAGSMTEQMLGGLYHQKALSLSQVGISFLARIFKATANNSKL